MDNQGSTFVEYERGIDKIADLDLAEPDFDQIIYLNDVWQQYHLKFTVFSYEGDEQMLLDFKHEKDGKIQTMQMKRSSRPDKWLYSKYGMNVIPWECHINLANHENSETGEFKDDLDA